MSVSIEIPDLDRVIRKLGRLRAFSELREQLEQGVDVIHEAIATYPPPPEGSEYVRTGTLGRRWTTKVESLTAFRGVIGNNTLYGPYVQDAGEQARIHRGRWQTIQSVVAEKRDQVVGFFRARIKELLRS